MEQKTACLFFSIICSLPVYAQVSQEDAQVTGPDRDTSSDTTEIIVTERTSIPALQHRVKEAELRIYDIFNDLNEDEKYDIHCINRAPTGRHVKDLECYPEYYRQTTAYRSQGLSSAEGLLPFYNENLRQKMSQLVKESPELMDAIQEHYELTLELEALREQK